MTKAEKILHDKLALHHVTTLSRASTVQGGFPPSCSLRDLRSHKIKTIQLASKNTNQPTKVTMKVASIASSLALVLLGAAVQYTQAEESCIVYVVNHAYDGLTVNSYDPVDTACLIPYDRITTNYGNGTYPLLFWFLSRRRVCVCVCVPLGENKTPTKHSSHMPLGSPLPVAEFECQGFSCKMKVAGALNCGGTAEVDCGKYLVYYTNKDGALTYCLSDDETCEKSSRQLVQDQEPEPSKAAQRMLRSSRETGRA